MSGKTRQVSNINRAYLFMQVIFHSIFMFFHELLIIIPGVTPLILFVRNRIYGKRPPRWRNRSFTQVPLDQLTGNTHDDNLILEIDDLGLRLTSGQPAITTNKKRSSLKPYSTTDLKVEVTTTLNLDAGHDTLQFKLFRSTGKSAWTILEITHNLQQVYGMAEKFGSLNKQGKLWRFYNMDMIEIEPKHDPLYKSYPVAIIRGSSYWYAIIVDYPGYQQWDLRKDTEMEISLQHTSFVLDIIAGESPKEILEQLSNLLGTMDLPPLWSLGFHQCRWSYNPAERIREVAKEFRSRDIPCDAIYLDIDYMEDFKIFTWDPKKFGDMPALVDDLHELGFKAVAMVDPGIKTEKGYFIYEDILSKELVVTKKNGVPYRSVVWPGKVVFPDFFDPQVAEWWGELYREFVEMGIDGFWNDMNEPTAFNLRGTMADDARHRINGSFVPHHQLHNLYGPQMARNSYEGLTRLFGRNRIFLLSRAAYLGSQRYGWIWTGDNKSSWTHLQQSIPKLLNSGLSGQFASGADIGGFRGKPSPELFARWMALGLFYPLMRNHTIKFSDDQEPWSFGDEITAISRKIIKLRYKLVPYIYTYFQEGCTTGVPLMRPMWLEFPDDEMCYQTHVEDTQFMFGPSLLAAPILKNKQTSREVYLPEGIWHHYFDSTTYTGRGFHEFHADLDDIIILVRDNSIIPQYRLVGKNMEETARNGIYLNKFGAQPQGQLYVDDGRTDAYKDGDYALYHLNGETIELVEGNAEIDPNISPVNILE